MYMKSLKETNSNKLSAILFVASLLGFSFLAIADKPEGKAAPPPAILPPSVINPPQVYEDGSSIMSGGFIFDCKEHPTILNGFLCTILPVQYEGDPQLRPDVQEDVSDGIYKKETQAKVGI